MRQLLDSLFKAAHNYRNTSRRKGNPDGQRPASLTCGMSSTVPASTDGQIQQPTLLPLCQTWAEGPVVTLFLDLDEEDVAMLRGQIGELNEHLCMSDKKTKVMEARNQWLDEEVGRLNLLSDRHRDHIRSLQRALDDKKGIINADDDDNEDDEDDDDDDCTCGYDCGYSCHGVFSGYRY
ncbi:hypothetical protein BX661DRAFT_200679 [Kickxella alabastrina]|uniref:uncharacterized protein n=1 Tax=Kickxella alabastrina TaxID=61397 RepID=UPI00221E5FAE|nr:uncharacterized protein BX661DRAFT_200679 [Kickxella alabastrina]KAI7821438.1 hypothetical protein BX661DRAFT_200679 [Kickxella alabastrina]